MAAAIRIAKFIVYGSELERFRWEVGSDCEVEGLYLKAFCKVNVAVRRN